MTGGGRPTRPDRPTRRAPTHRRVATPRVEVRLERAWHAALAVAGATVGAIVVALVHLRR